MGILLSCREIKKEFGEINIINNISFDIAVGERIGLVGLNGSGKTTLANIIAGSLEIDGGSLCWHKSSVNIGYLKQESAYVENLFDIANIKDYLYTSSTLGLRKICEWDDQKLKNLSGGEKTKLSLSQIWSLDPDFLILDEPTNHLDYQGVKWLVKELKKYKGTVLIISHDRYFLDECVTRIIEIENKTLQNYNGNYSFYREEKKRRYENQLNEYILQEEKKKKISEQINALKDWSAKAHRDAPAKAAASGNKMGGKEFLRAKAKKMDTQIKSRIKRLEKIKIEGVEKPKQESKISFRLKPATLRGNRIIEASNIDKAFNDKVLFKDSSFYIKKGEKVAIFGDNGCGKTTLLKVLMGIEEADKGEIFLSASAKLGYLSQDIAHLDLKKKVLDCFHITSREEKGRLQTLLFNMGFSENMLTHAIGTLSLGELTRLRIAELITNECDLLILDEPLNHLDIHSREKLEEVLLNYNGTIILVSHDKYMMDRICNKLLVFENNRVKRIDLGLKEYLENNLNSKKDNLKEIKEKKMLVENEISYILGELSKYAEGTDEYMKTDLRFMELMNAKKEMEGKIKQS
jgi:macrolide transport system ATP-binding/permease protein